MTRPAALERARQLVTETGKPHLVVLRREREPQADMYDVRSAYDTVGPHLIRCLWVSVDGSARVLDSGKRHPGAGDGAEATEEGR